MNWKGVGVGKEISGGVIAGRYKKRRQKINPPAAVARIKIKENNPFILLTMVLKNRQSKLGSLR